MQLMTLPSIIIIVVVVGLQRNLHLAEIQVLYNILPPPLLFVTSAAAVDETLNFSQSRAIYERAFLCKTATLRKRAWTTKALPYNNSKDLDESFRQHRQTRRGIKNSRVS